MASAGVHSRTIVTEALNIGDTNASDGLQLDGEAVYASAKVNESGRVDLALNAKSLLEQHHLPALSTVLERESESSASLPLSIVLQVVGSRGDVQPFVALGQALQEAGHRVRIATHDVFASFVRDVGLEFYPIGGDPSELMAFMVKNPGIIPKFESVRHGEIGRKKKMIYEMLQGCWKSCIGPDPVSQQPFVADAIIANPPSFAHIHCAQALGVPLHMMFTMPWSPTRSFAHPLSNVKSTGMDPSVANYLSYEVVGLLTWHGLRTVINSWREKFLSLEHVPTLMGPSLLEHFRVPFTYCWSPALIPKPIDWPSYIGRQEPLYDPPTELTSFLNAGTPPIYIGFGSIVIDDPAKLTNLILEAVATCGVRAVVSRGWSNLGEGRSQQNVLFLGECPHEWLFKYVAAVVHHGGAGTTACGLLNARPTAIVPFFGEQPFWGSMVASAGAGPSPIPYKSLNHRLLGEAIRFCLTPSATSSAAKIAAQMQHEQGVQEAVASFHRQLPVQKLQCDLLTHEVACWSYQKGKKRFKLSERAASILIAHDQVDVKDFVIYQPSPIRMDNKRWDPVTGTSSALLRVVSDVSSGAADVVVAPIKSAKRGDHAKEALTASGKGAVKMTTSLVRGSLLTLPLGFADGMHQLPALWGETPRDNGEVIDWISGATVAGKAFSATFALIGCLGSKALAWGFLDGTKGLIMDPYKGAKADGVWGFAKGVATGTMGLLFKPGAGMFGLLAYPTLGIYKSLSHLKMSQAQMDILAARQAQSAFNAQHRPLEVGSVQDLQVLHEFRRRLQS